MTNQHLPAGRQDNPPVHEMTKTGPGWRYGCHDHQAHAKGYYAPNRIYRPDGTFYIVLARIETEWIKYDVCPAEHDHQGCRGCVHGGGHERV